MKNLHEKLMDDCRVLAREAMRLGEVPIAAIVARGDGSIVGRGWNELKAKRDRTLHAEIAAFRDAAGRYPVSAKDLILVSTLEPCIMCAGAAYLCGVQSIVYGLSAPMDGGMSRIQPPESPESQTPEVIGPIDPATIMMMFQEWIDCHESDDEQMPYVKQLLEHHSAL